MPSNFSNIHSYTPALLYVVNCRKNVGYGGHLANCIFGCPQIQPQLAAARNDVDLSLRYGELPNGAHQSLRGGAAPLNRQDNFSGCRCRIMA